MQRFRFILIFKYSVLCKQVVIEVHTQILQLIQKHRQRNNNKELWQLKSCYSIYPFQGCRCRKNESLFTVDTFSLSLEFPFDTPAADCKLGAGWIWMSKGDIGDTFWEENTVFLFGSKSGLLEWLLSRDPSEAIANWNWEGGDTLLGWW